VNISPFGMASHRIAWHRMTDINNFESMGISDELLHQFRSLHLVLLSIGDLVSIWQPDDLMIWSVGN
jgi:hypothetical protein